LEITLRRAYAFGAGIGGKGHEGTLDADIAEKMVIERAQMPESLALLGWPRKPAHEPSQDSQK
jgi:hypothetical protein